MSSDAAARAALPELYRRILQLRFLDSCSVREAVLGVTVTYAKVTYQPGQHALAVCDRRLA